MEPIERFIGVYRIVARLGDGGMGTVYHAIAPDGKDVAIKQFSKTHDLRRWREIAALQRLNHPNIIGYIDHGDDYLVMPLLNGLTLADYFTRGGSFSHEEAFDLIAQICDGLTALHELGAIHRDIKPDNIFLVQREKDAWQAVILDFGIVKIAGDEELTNPHLVLRPNDKKMVMGTPAHMSPEQAGGEALEPRSDLYAVGLILLQALTGHTLHDTSADIDPSVLMTEIVKGKMPGPEFEVQMSSGAWNLLLRLLALNVKKRPTAAETSQALRRLIAGEDPFPSPTNPAKEESRGAPAALDVPVPLLSVNSKKTILLGALSGVLCALILTPILMPQRKQNEIAPFYRAPLQRAVSPPPPRSELPRLEDAPRVAETPCPVSKTFRERNIVGRHRVPDRAYWWCQSAPRRQKLCTRFSRYGHAQDVLVQELCAPHP
jgi:serine/threonine-protein kinase